MNIVALRAEGAAKQSSKSVGVCILHHMFRLPSRSLDERMLPRFVTGLKISARQVIGNARTLALVSFLM